MKVKIHIYKEEGDSVGKKISTEEKIYSVEDFSYNMDNKVFGLSRYDFWLGMNADDVNTIISGIDGLEFIKKNTAENIANLKSEIDIELKKLHDMNMKIKQIIGEL